MRKKTVASLIFISALAFANAANTYRVSLYQSTVVNGTTFKAGDCKVEVRENQVTLKQGKNTAEATVRIENGDHKYNDTSVGYTSGDRIQEIRLGGTNTKLLFDAGSAASTSGGR